MDEPLRHLEVSSVHNFRPVLSEQDMEDLLAFFNEVQPDNAEGDKGLRVLGAIISPYTEWKRKNGR